MSLPANARPPLLEDALADLTRRAYHSATCLAPALERDYFAAVLRHIAGLEAENAHLRDALPSSLGTSPRATIAAGPVPVQLPARTDEIPF